MRYNQQSSYLMIKYLLIPFILLAALSGCGSSDDDKGTGYINLYNVSANAPGIFLTLDEDDDDEVEITYSSVLYSKVSGNNELEAQPYFIELAWQDEDSSDRSDLEVIYESQLEVMQDEIQFIMLAQTTYWR